MLRGHFAFLEKRKYIGYPLTMSRCVCARAHVCVCVDRYIGQPLWGDRSHLYLFVGIADPWIVKKKGQYQGIC